MSVLRNRMFTSYKHFQDKLATPTLSLFNLAQIQVSQLVSPTSQTVPLCTSSAHICLRQQWKKQTGQYLFVRSGNISLNHVRTGYSSMRETDNQQQERLLSQMNIRLVNENNFLSWCRNTYLSSVVGVAMITEGTTVLAQSAGVGALVVAMMNLFWGTGCHITNLIRLRHISGMSGFNMTMNILGSSFHFFLWLFVLTCYIGFLDETSVFVSQHKVETSMSDLEVQRFDKHNK
ncbi:unnamed protein product [Candidula unifasciata]|uniref:Transmembrane protein n=1 Tax=Candidula unifasciata TaxID=100452 RepID=A0A8S4A4J2_9EUPU|nr:unnamed protein product [Candidula unifasciata]